MSSEREFVWCEHPGHPNHGRTAHRERGDGPWGDDWRGDDSCLYPHAYAPPNYHVPALGHPYTVHD